MRCIGYKDQTPNDVVVSQEDATVGDYVVTKSTASGAVVNESFHVVYFTARRVCGGQVNSNDA